MYQWKFVEGCVREAELPVHGFVLAGGKSSRMGQDKALLEFRGQPLVKIAVEKLRVFCAAVSVAGDREDLGSYASVVRERRLGCGPAAGVESGLLTSTEAWAMFLPVDVPGVPASVLRAWAEGVLRDPAACSFLTVHGVPQPAFCMLRRQDAAAVTAALDAGVRSLRQIFEAVSARAGGRGTVAVEVAHLVAGHADATAVEHWFRNLNTPADVAAAAAGPAAGMPY